MMNPFSGLNFENTNIAPQKDVIANYKERRANLKPHVRSYTDRLHEGILGFLQSHGARSMQELSEFQISGKVRLRKSELENLIKMLSELESALNKNELPELKEIAKIGEGEEFVFAGERVFVVSKNGDSPSGEPEVSFYAIDEPEERWRFSNEMNRYAVDNDGGRILRVDDNGQMWDVRDNPIGPKLSDDMTEPFSSGGVWFASSMDVHRTQWSLHFYKPDNGWGVAYSSCVIDMDYEPCVDNGEVYVLDVHNDIGISTGFYRVWRLGEVIKEGKLKGCEDWKMSDGEVFFRGSNKNGEIVFYMADQPVYVLKTSRKLWDWNIKKGILHVSLRDKDGKQTLYCIDLKISGQTQKSKTVEDSDSNIQDDLDIDFQDDWDFDFLYGPDLDS